MEVSNKAPKDFFDNWNKIQSMSYKNVIELLVKRSSEKKILALIQFELDQFSENVQKDLIISDASGSCGCTVPDYPKNSPIKPGESGKIIVKFDSNNRPGMQRKAVTLITNTSKGKQILNIKSIVIPKS